MSCRLDDGHASASCIRGVGVCRIGRRQLCRKLAVAKANGMRLVGTGSVNVSPPPHYCATRSGPFTLHGLRLVAMVLKGISNSGWSYENGIDPFDPTCFVATVQFWCTVKWHFFGGHQGPMIRSGSLASPSREIDYSQLSNNSEIRGRKARLDNACVQNIMEGYFCCCRSAPSATS
jgi:hypothetical protein